MQAFNYTLRLLLCRPLLLMFGGIFLLCFVLTVLASFILPSLTLQASLVLGAKIGGMLAGALWAMFFLKTYTAVLASEKAASFEDEADHPAVAENSQPQGGDHKSGVNKPE